ncbi:MAG: hypothetical protein ACOZNI_08475 [Myxococcota bacterium]
MIALLAGVALAEEPCDAFFAPAEVVEAALRVDGARRAGADAEAERRVLVVRLACASEPLAPGDAAAVHVALAEAPPSPVPAPTPKDLEHGPPKPDGGVALVDGVPHAALRPATPAVVQAFDAKGQVIYTRWLDAAEVEAVRGGRALPTSPSRPKLPPVPLSRGEVVRLVASSALVVASGTLLVVAADARADWYALDPSPVSTVADLERLRVRANVTQGAGLAAAALGGAGLLSVAVRVPF